DPQRRAGKSGVSVGPDWEEFAAIAGIRRIDIPAKSAEDRLIWRRLRSGELLDCGSAKGLHPISRPMIQHHLREFREIVASSEQSGMACNSAHEPGCFVVDHSA